MFLAGRIIVVHICAASPAALLVTFRGFCQPLQANDEIGQGRLLSCAQFVMFPYSSSRCEVKLLLVVINHLEVEIYGGDET